MEKQDIIIVGSGCAGLFAALQLPQDKKITIITKDCIEHSDSFLAQGGICVLKTPEDYQSFFDDTLKAGHYENRKESVDIMIRSSRDTIQELINYGVVLPMIQTAHCFIPVKALTASPVFCTTRTKPERRLPPACCRKSVHIVPMFSF